MDQTNLTHCCASIDSLLLNLSKTWSISIEFSYFSDAHASCLLPSPSTSPLDWADTLGFFIGGIYSDTVDRYCGGYDGALSHGESDNAVEAIATMRDDADEVDSASLASASSSLSCASAVEAGSATGSEEGMLPNILEPRPKGLLGLLEFNWISG